MNLDARVWTKVPKFPCSELSPIIRDNIVGHTNLYMISLMNSTTLAVVIEAVCFTSIHFVNLSTAMKMCVNPPLAFLNGPTKSSPHVEKGQVIGIVCSWCDGTSFWRAKNWQPSHRWTTQSASDTAMGQKNPYLYALPMRVLAPVWLPQIPTWTSCSIAHPSSSVMHFIRVPLAPRRKSSSFTRV
jgi:hypothetical protein